MAVFQFTIQGLLDVDEDLLGLAGSGLVPSSGVSQGVAEISANLRFDSQASLRILLQMAVIDCLNSRVGQGRYSLPNLQVTANIQRESPEHA